MKIGKYGMRIAEYRKALVSGIGAATTLVVSALDSFGAHLPPGVTHWLATGVVFATAVATFLTKNAPPETSTEPATPTTIDEPAVVNPGARQMGLAMAGLAVVLGGAMLAGRNGRRKPDRVTPFALPQGS